jgi:hypothetical protein
VAYQPKRWAFAELAGRLKKAIVAKAAKVSVSVFITIPF